MSRDPGDEDDAKRDWDDFIGEVTDLGYDSPDDSADAEG
jgi:hypothetical protein